MKETSKGRKLVTYLVLLTSILGGTTSWAANWWETIKVKGDFRYRHEMIDKESKNQRNRQRIRARFRPSCGCLGLHNSRYPIGDRL